MKKNLIIIVFLLLLLLIFISIVKYKVITITNFKNEKEYVIINKIKNKNESFNFLKANAISKLDYADLLIYKNPKDSDIAFSKKENKFSRLLALPGDIFQIIDGEIFINNQQITINTDIYSRYRLTMQDSCNFEKLLENKIIRIEKKLNEKSCNIVASPQQIDSLRKIDGILNLRKIIIHNTNGYYDIFPHTSTNLWNEDNFGPILIPKKGTKIEINRKTYDIYKKIIDIFENNIIEERFGRYYLNGKEIRDYSFNENYYFVINDDRTNIDDSRKLGFIPEEEIYGKIIY